MMVGSRNYVLGIGLLFLMGCTTYAPSTFSEDTFSKAEISEDLDAFIEFVKQTHPDLEYSADLEALDSKVAQVRQNLPAKATLRQAWMAMALVNPLFGDAHIGLRRPVAALEDFQKKGGVLFPAAIVFDNDGQLRIADTGANAAGFVAGDKIISINGVLADDIVEKTMPRMRGESEALQKLVLQRYFPEYFWIAYGGFDKYVVRVRRNGRVKIVQAEQRSQDNLDDAGNVFSFKQLGDDIGYLNVKSFDIGYKDAFAQFTADTFAEIQVTGVKSLIIDLRENGGGAHDVSDLLMNYLTDKPFSSISGLRARITAENVDRIPGVEIGDVVNVPFQLTITPDLENPLRFTGETYALIGAVTYSQAIAFASTLQDYKIATIAGEETEGPANQSGQVQSQFLNNTGLQALAPIYIFTRKSGDTSRRGVIPEIEIAHDPLDSWDSVQALKEIINANQRE